MLWFVYISKGVHNEICELNNMFQKVDCGAIQLIKKCKF